jgi:hypothetical protein
MTIIISSICLTLGHVVAEKYVPFTKLYSAVKADMNKEKNASKNCQNRGFD